MQIRYIGTHRPKGMIVDVSEDIAKDAIKSGEFVKVEEEKPQIMRKLRENK